jgi:tRNA nucleotidyltransferase (CCA-adding enzyme)
MDLILTHDNADFDAVAAQLAAHKLMPGAIPVLPHRTNRNVRHFMALYWDELPFIRAKDLPKSPVDRITLVDTQTLQTPRGMHDETTVHIIDHHTPRESLDPAWHVTVEAVGAAATILVERIRGEHTPLTPVEATLLLLGIYEDTGSLTYGTTTPRDAYAAAWLLERGALLDVANDFLQHALSEDQVAVFERLQENAETYDVEGHPVVIATAKAYELTEEVATLAHKLRDLLDPAAVFLLVDLSHHIQLVARSTVDAINVGEIARKFGGGGHGRASAAIIRDMTLAQARQTLLAEVKRTVQPSPSVADLMSHGVQTLPPDARADEADREMRRYGYEGFPVVDDGQVIGLLTRRAVDRALDHGLDGVRVERLMDAGRVTVEPGDSMATLQQTMMQSGWGQIPVVDEQKRIVGVVTRTDLIQHMGHQQTPAPRRAEIARLLDDALPPLLMALVRRIGQIAGEMDFNLYVVGGFVRDLLLHLPTADVDFVVEGNAIALTRALCKRFGGDTRSHGRFGTGKWLLDEAAWRGIAAALDVPPGDLTDLPAHIDFATARTEFYDAPTVLPEVERSSIKLDLHRRDFTINTLAIRLDPRHFGQILDFYGGEADLRNGVIRVLHSLSFVDDPTRILRAVRFEQRLCFEIEPRTEELIRHALPMLDRVTGDRLKHEVEAALAERRPERVFCRLDELGVLVHLHPGLSCDVWLFSAYRALRQAVAKPLWPELGGDFNLELPYFALLTYRLTLPGVHLICNRLHVRRRTIDTLVRVVRLRGAIHRLSEPLPPSEIDRLLAGVDDDVLVTLWAAAPDAIIRQQIVDYARSYRHVTPVTTGHTLEERGLKPGPAYGRILDALRAARLDGEIETPAGEARLLDRLLAEEDYETPD